MPSDTRRNRSRTLITRSVAPWASAFALAAFHVAASAQEPPALSSQAVDPSIYRDGEVKRFSSKHGQWVVVCDEITRLKQRFCSLRSAIVGADGGRVGELTVSTGQDGRPAALLKMFTSDIRGGELTITIAKALPSRPATVSTTPQVKTKKVKSETAATTRLRPAACDAGTCTLIWTLKPEQIRALNDGIGLELSVTPGASLLPNQHVATRLVVSAEGFKEAVEQSIRPFE
jgi:invasion protein IalB